MNRPRNFTICLILLLAIDLVIATYIVGSHGLRVGGSLLMAPILLFIYSIGFASIWQLFVKPVLGILLGLVFFGLQIVNIVSPGHSIGVVLGLDVSFLTWQSTNTALYLNLWALAMFIFFLIGLYKQIARSK